MDIEVRRIRAGEGELLSQLRLAALQDSPAAFASTHEREVGNGSERWEELAATRAHGDLHATFLAFADGEAVGLVGGHREEIGGEVQLVSMWTRPDARGNGVGAALVAAVIVWAGGDPVELWVTRGNDSAERLYERCGFVVTCDHQPLPSDPCKDEIRMRHEPAPAGP